MTGCWLIILRIICILQIIAAVYRSFISLIGLIQEGGFIYLFQAIAFVIIAVLPVQLFIILSENYPDKRIEGKRKRSFNRMFLINVLLIGFLFGFVFFDYQVSFYVSDIYVSVGDGASQLFDFIVSVSMLIFQFVILYGLFWLRTTINKALNSKHFDFERPDKNV